MKWHKFKIDLPCNHVRTYVFFSLASAYNKHSYFMSKDSRFNPSAIVSEEKKGDAIIIDVNNKYVEYDLDGLLFVGARKCSIAGAVRDEHWYAAKGKEENVRKELQRSRSDFCVISDVPRPATALSRWRSLKSAFRSPGKA